MNYPENDYRNYLAHHGILGMKWGIKNGPPYPLGVEDHNASERKAGWMESLKSRFSRSKKSDLATEPEDDDIQEIKNMLQTKGYSRDETYSGKNSETWSKEEKKIDNALMELKFYKRDYNLDLGNGRVFHRDKNTIDDVKKYVRTGENFCNNYKEYEPILKRAIVNDLKSRGGWGNVQDVSPKKLKDGFVIDYVSIEDDNRVYVSFYDKAGNIGYHSASLELDLKNKKPSRNVAIEG